MIRLAFLSALLLTSCVAADPQPTDPQPTEQATDPQPTESSVDRSITSHCTDRKFAKKYSCILPRLWDPRTESTIDDFWFGASTNEPAKVMIHFETFGRLAAEVGTGETDNSIYVFFVAGAPGGANKFWKALEVKGSDIDQFQNTMQGLYKPREQGLSVWDGGAGGPLGGSPGGHIGPHGFPLIAINDMLRLTADMRSLYGAGVNNSIHGMTQSEEP
jgi:hypothetical protein